MTRTPIACVLAGGLGTAMEVSAFDDRPNTILIFMANSPYHDFPLE